ncbi:Aste57867_11987 [Aphanomyces stellatus]|uniref:Aste57867_11987 protein n=1 Tax=Aphanomyces stellatus TaxID=120398 RepID=A0A485KUD5_9STRA|nr:hypothetical protein As57867_011942 [Aphanomyces stellatus]VFT88842.1 Aste57867_11987 [Aphanomyces stellatus]
MAPEVIQHQNYTGATDIYSFGTWLRLLFATHQIPYENEVNPKNGQKLGDVPIMVKVVAGQLKPSFGHDCPQWVREMALECVAFDPTQRPSAMQLSHRIRAKMRQDYSVV